MPSNHGNPVPLKAIDYPGRVSIPVGPTVTYDLDFLVPLKDLEEVLVEIVMAPGDQDGPSTSRLQWLRFRHVLPRNESVAHAVPARIGTTSASSEGGEPLEGRERGWSPVRGSLRCRSIGTRRPICSSKSREHGSPASEVIMAPRKSTRSRGSHEERTGLDIPAAVGRCPPRRRGTPESPVSCE